MEAGEQLRLPESSGSVPGRESREHSPHELTETQCDLQLVRRLCARDEQAWRSFVRNTRALLLHRIQSTASELHQDPPSADVTEEICAEVFSQLMARDMECLRQFSGRSRLTTWLSVVVRRTAIRALLCRRGHAIQPEPGQFESLADESSRPQQDFMDDSLRIQQGMALLSDDDRRLLELFYENQQSYEHIAAVFHVTVNAVGPKLDRARRRLRKILESRQDLLQ